MRCQFLDQLLQSVTLVSCERRILLNGDGLGQRRECRGTVA